VGAGSCSAGGELEQVLSTNLGVGVTPQSITIRMPSRSLSSRDCPEMPSSLLRSRISADALDSSRPDFPTGAQILGARGIRDTYTTGRWLDHDAGVASNRNPSKCLAAPTGTP